MANSLQQHRAKVCLLLVFLVNWAEATEYLASRCGQTIYIGSSGDTLDSQSGLYYASNLDCSVTIWADFGRRILLTFERVDIEPALGFTCSSADYLRVYDGSSIYNSRLGGDICGNTIPSDITSTSNSITLRFRTDYLLEYTGFFLAYTSFSEEFFGSCEVDEFECDNNRCIDSSLRFDSHDNCGDNSDEVADIDTYGLSVGIIVAIVVGCLVGVIVFAVCIGCICCHACKSSPGTHNTVVVAPAPQRPAYNQQLAIAMRPIGQPAPPHHEQTAPPPYGGVIY